MKKKLLAVFLITAAILIAMAIPSFAAEDEQPVGLAPTNIGVGSNPVLTAQTNTFSSENRYYTGNIQISWNGNPGSNTYPVFFFGNLGEASYTNFISSGTTGTLTVKIQQLCTKEQTVKVAITTNKEGSTTITVPAVGHNYVDNGVDQAATCVATGVMKTKCEYCDDEKTRVIDIEPTNHTGEGYETVTLAATCTATGLKDVYACDDCNALIEADVEVAIDPDNHTGEGYETVTLAATCTATGLKDVYACEDCNALVEVDVEIAIDPDNHTGEGYETVTLAATCTATGLKDVYACDDCNALLIEDEEVAIDPSNHVGDTYKKVVTKATCTTDGLMGIYCESCKEQVDSEVITAPGHNPGKKHTTEPSSCTGVGSWEIRCKVCRVVLETGVVDIAAHTPGAQTTTKDATCTEDGEWEECCEVCNERLDGGSIPALEHTQGEKVITKKAEYKVAGAWEICCTVCQNVIESGTIDALTLTNVTNAKYVSIVETSKNSKVWALTFTYTAVLSDGSSITLTETVNLNGNNANLDGKYKFAGDLEGYTLTYDIKGNGSNIKTFSIGK